MLHGVMVAYIGLGLLLAAGVVLVFFDSGESRRARALRRIATSVSAVGIVVAAGGFVQCFAGVLQYASSAVERDQLRAIPANGPRDFLSLSVTRSGSTYISCAPQAKTGVDVDSVGVWNATILRDASDGEGCLEIVTKRIEYPLLTPLGFSRDEYVFHVPGARP